ncbi:hypothetical protein BBP40_004734 [Aspergillus hancockii]|nr:hypothetical protein BBP40_004734 [Aspergillus hancockii]
MASNSSTLADYDVIIVGAGISGISFAYRLQERNPNLHYCILEARHEIGGTWSLFQYPGIRSDSDLHTFGFPWRPWIEKDAIAHGSKITQYLKDSAAQEGIDQNIKYHHRVERITWSTATKAWTLQVAVNGTGAAKVLHAQFIMLGTGYYDYDEPMYATIPGIESFKGSVIHPQFWPKDLDHAGKSVAIIGSGATAITLLPAMAEKATHVTMLQRSPTYIASVPREDKVENAIRTLFPTLVASKLIRFKWMLVSFVVVTLCQWFPNLARWCFRRKIQKELPKGMPLDPDFNPSYTPWQQRLCVCPDGDFYACLRNGSGSIKTGVIDVVTTTSIKLKSGEELHPDIIVTATGLKLRLAGGMEIVVDDTPFHIPDHFMWKGAMIEGLPNLVFAFGYVDASWTLGADASAQLACRLLHTMRQEAVSMIVPRLTTEEKQKMRETPLLYLSSTYVQKGQSVLPRVGDHPQWCRRSYYWKDILGAWWGDIRTGMEWRRLKEENLTL